MIRKWEKRIQRLEALLQSSARRPAVFRFGRVQYLDENMAGERHIVVSESLSTAVPQIERCEFAERLGPPPDDGESSFNVYLDLGEGSDSPSPRACEISPVPEELSPSEVDQERIL